MIVGVRLAVVIALLLACVHCFVLPGSFAGRSSTSKNLFGNPFSSKSPDTTGGNKNGGMFGGLGDIMEMAKKAEKVKKELEVVTMLTKDPSGVVEVTFNGMGEPQGVKVSEDALKLGAEALSKALTNTLLTAHKQAESAKMKSMMGGLGLPGF